jgi:hypothetical protein
LYCERLAGVLVVILVEPKLVSCHEKFKIQIEFLIKLNKILIQ